MQIMFPFLERPPKGSSGSVGHWFKLTIDILEKKFRIYDSLREPGDINLEKVCSKLIRKIKRLCREGLGIEETKVQMLDDFEVVYEHMPLQDNG